MKKSLLFAALFIMTALLNTARAQSYDSRSDRFAREERGYRNDDDRYRRNRDSDGYEERFRHDRRFRREERECREHEWRERERRERWEARRWH